MAKEPKMKIGIGADTGDFEKGSKKVKDALKQLGIDANSAAGKMVASLGKATVALAGVVTAIKAVGEALNELKDQNQVLADSWGRACEGMTGAFETFKSAIVSLDFTNLISNMSEAARLAQDLYDAADAMGEISTAYNISLAQQLGKIDELRLKIKDTSISEQERVQAGQELLRIYEQLEKNPTRGLGRVSDTTIDYYMQRMGVNMENRTDTQLAAMRKKYLEFFKFLGTEQGESFLSAAETIAKSGGLDSYWGKTALANARKAGLEENLRLAYAYSTKMGDDDREKLEQAVVAYLRQENKYAQETFKIRTQIQQIENEGAKAAESASSAASAAADRERDSAKSILKRAEDSAKSELQLLSEKYSQEKELLEKYHLDTSALWDEYSKNVQKLLDVNIKDIKTITLEIDVDDIDMSEADAELQANIDDMLNEMTRYQPIIDELNNQLTDMVSNMAAAFGQLFVDLASGEDAWGNLVNAAMSAFGDMAIAIGKIAISTGMASEGIKEALSLDNPYVAIAAGVALVALGTAVKAGLSNIANGNYSSSAGIATSGSSSSFTSDYEQRDVYVNVTGTLQADGDQLVAVINNTEKKNRLTT